MGCRVFDVLSGAGYRCVLQDKDFGHKNFLSAMDRGLISAKRIIALFSPDYFRSKTASARPTPRSRATYSTSASALSHYASPSAIRKRSFSAIAYLDLVPLREADDETLKTAILAAVKPGAVQQQAIVGPLTHLWRAPRGLLHEFIGPQPDFTGREKELG